MRSAKTRDYVVDTVFLGGGTPSVLESQQIAEIMETVGSCFRLKKDAEITIEVNPGTVNEEKLKECQKAGVNRISFGVQSLQNKELELLGRIHTTEEFLKNYEAARRTGFLNINIDLMSALPGQTLQDVKKNIREAVRLSPEHLSCYGLIIEEGTHFYEVYKEQELRRQAGEERLEDELPTEQEEREMYQWIGEFLKEQGYVHYEISNYAKPGRECRHNLKYWERKDYLGVGLGAASLLQEVRFSNVRDMKRYLQIDFYQNPVAVIAEQEMIDKKAAMEEFMFLGLRKIRGISQREFYESFHEEYSKVYGKVHEKLLRQGLLVERGDRIFLSKQGIDVSNYVMGEYL